MQPSEQFTGNVLSLGKRLFPGVEAVEVRGVAAPVSFDDFLRKSASNLARLCTGPRNVPFRVVRESIEKLHRLGRIRGIKDLQQVLDIFSANVNLVHVIHKAPESLPELQASLRDLFVQNSPVMDHLGIKTLLHRAGLLEQFQVDPDIQQTWLRHARQVRRLLASPDDFFDDEVKRQLRFSYSGDINDYYSRSSATKYLKRWMALNHLNSTEWLTPSFQKTYDAEVQEQRFLDYDAQHFLHRSFYDAIFKLHNTRTLDNQDLRRFFFRTVTESDPSKSDLPPDFIVQAYNWFQAHEQPGPDGERFRLSHEAMNKVLRYAHQKMQKYIIARERRGGSAPDPYKDFHDRIVALQRTVAGYDHAVSLTTARLSESEVLRRVRYSIEPSDKDPIHFYTGGNDTGVCDSTAGPQRGTLKDTAVNPSMQFHEIFRVDSKGRRSRIGQIRMYLGEINKGSGRRSAPAILVNSIDLEAEERDNLLLYRRAVDYVKEFAQRVGVSEVRLGRHGDQHLMVFENSGKFPDLEPVQEQIRLTHFFNPSRVKPFSDFFRGSSYESGVYSESRGLANLYEVALPKPVLRRRR